MRFTSVGSRSSRTSLTSVLLRKRLSPRPNGKVDEGGGCMGEKDFVVMEVRREILTLFNTSEDIRLGANLERTEAKAVRVVSCEGSSATR